MVLDSWKRLYSNTPGAKFREVAVQGLWQGADVPNSPTQEARGWAAACDALCPMTGLGAKCVLPPLCMLSTALACRQAAQGHCHTMQQDSSVTLDGHWPARRVVPLHLRHCSRHCAVCAVPDALAHARSTLRAMTLRASPSGSATTSTPRRTPSTTSS